MSVGVGGGGWGGSIYTEEGGWVIGDGGGIGYEVGGWSRLKDEISGMKCVEHSTTIGHNVMNEYGIEDF